MDGFDDLRSNLRLERGFTLIELVVVMSIIVALAAVVVPMVGSAKRDGQATAIVATVDALRTACMKHHADTGRCPREFADSTATANRQLSAQQPNLPGWKGPYLNEPLSRSSNPNGGNIRVYNNFAQAYQGGFRLTGGALSATGEGSFVRIFQTPADIAQLVDTALDRGITGDWRTTGRVTYQGQNLYVFILDLDGQ